jgi:hypothetical protein
MIPNKKPVEGHRLEGWGQAQAKPGGGQVTLAFLLLPPRVPASAASGSARHRPIKDILAGKGWFTSITLPLTNLQFPNLSFDQSACDFALPPPIH